MIAAALKSNGFDYLQCQGGYDEGPGEQLVCFYHLLAMADNRADKDPQESACPHRALRWWNQR